MSRDGFVPVHEEKDPPPFAIIVGSLKFNVALRSIDPLYEKVLQTIRSLFLLVSSLN